LAARGFFALAGDGPLIDEPGRIQTLVGPLAVFAGSYFLLNVGMVAAAVTLDQRLPFFDTIRRHFRGLWLSFFGGASIAALVMLVMQSGTVSVGLVAIGLALVALLYLMVKGIVGGMQQQYDQLTGANRMYRSLIAGAAYGIARVSVTGRFIDANPA